MRLDGDIRLNCSASSIRHQDKKFQIHLKGAAAYQSSDAVIVAVPAYHAARLIEPMNEKLGTMLKAIRYVSTATISVAYLKEDLPANLTLDGFGVIIPPSEKRRIIAVTWASTKFKHRAPADCVLMRVFVGGYDNEALAEQPDDQLLKMIGEEFEDIFNIRAAPVLHKIYRWSKGNPQYDVGHLDRVNEIHALAATIPGLHLAGSAFRGIGMPDCIRNAQNTVEVLLGELA
jgi:oxygen-dependent protoporphyrinogen oxidase